MCRVKVVLIIVWCEKFSADIQVAGGRSMADLERNDSPADRFRSGVQWVNELLSLTSAGSR